MVDVEETVTEEIAEETTEEIQESPAQVEESEQGEATDPVYEPSYGYKAYDEEREFDDWAKAVLQAEGVASKELEDNLRGLYAKAGGFDHLKEEHTGLKDVHGKLASSHHTVVDRVEELQYYIDKDLGTFFKEASIPPEKIISYVQQLLAEKDMSPEELRVHQDNRQSLVDTFQHGRQTAALQEENQQLSKGHHRSEMERALGLPDAVAFGAKYDSLYGSGSFKEEVNNYGRLYFQQNEQDTTPLDAVLKTIERWQPALGTRMAVPSDLETAKKVQEAGKPGGHIPNIGAGSVSSSPTKKTFTSIADLKKHAKEREQQLAQ